MNLLSIRIRIKADNIDKKILDCFEHFINEELDPKEINRDEAQLTFKTYQKRKLKDSEISVPCFIDKVTIKINEPDKVIFWFSTNRTLFAAILVSIIWYFATIFSKAWHITIPLFSALIIIPFIAELLGFYDRFSSLVRQNSNGQNKHKYENSY